MAVLVKRDSKLGRRRCISQAIQIEITVVSGAGEYLRLRADSSWPPLFSSFAANVIDGFLLRDRQ
jgi:hypothetical protein